MQLLASQDVNLWTGVDYLWISMVFFISCLDSHFDGTHSLQRIHWWASDLTLHLAFILSGNMHFSVGLTLSSFPSDSGAVFWRNITISHHRNAFHNHLDHRIDMDTSLQRRAWAKSNHMIIYLYLWMFIQLVIYLAFLLEAF